MRPLKTSTTSLGAALTVLAFASLAATADTPPDADWRHDGSGFETVLDPGESFFALPEPLAPLLEPGAAAEKLLDRVLTHRHSVPIGHEQTLQVTEYFTLRSWLRQPRRAVLFLTGTATRASFWAIPAPGYNGPEMAARRGLFAFTVDYIGVGDNYRPGGNARESTFEANQEALKVVLRFVRFFRAVARVDLVGESWGGAHATQLAADKVRVRSCVMSSMTYREIANPAFTAPEFVDFLKQLKDHYIPNGPDLYESITVGAPGEVIDFARKTQPGPYLTTQLWQIIEGLPHFDPSVAQVPGLVISGTAESKDSRQLAADYGTDGAQFLEIEGAGHVPRVEAPGRARIYWEKVFEFIDP